MAKRELSYEEQKAQLAKQARKADADRKKEQRRICRLAINNGGTVPYSLDTLLELNISVTNIRKIYRSR